MQGSMQHLNPDGLHKNPAFSPGVGVTGHVKTVYVGGQHAVDASGRIVDTGDIEAQREQVLKTRQTALAGGGAKLAHVVNTLQQTAAAMSVSRGSRSLGAAAAAERGR
jgi:enamine deaminase RidA (YjgF/YER057c/UK114 family)